MPYGIDSENFEKIDPEILPVVIELNNNGFKTLHSCSGHKNSENVLLRKGGISIKKERVKNVDDLEKIYKILHKHNLNNIHIEEHEFPISKKSIWFSFSPIGSSKGTSGSEFYQPHTWDEHPTLLWFYKLNPAEKVYAIHYEKTFIKSIPDEIVGYITEERAEDIRELVDKDRRYTKNYAHRQSKLSSNKLKRKPMKKSSKRVTKKIIKKVVRKPKRK